MIVPLTLADFLERAEHVYGDREAIVDEPNPPGGGLGRITYRQVAAMVSAYSSGPGRRGAWFVSQIGRFGRGSHS